MYNSTELQPAPAITPLHAAMQLFKWLLLKPVKHIPQWFFLSLYCEATNMKINLEKLI